MVRDAGSAGFRDRAPPTGASRTGPVGYPRRPAPMPSDPRPTGPPPTRRTGASRRPLWARLFGPPARLLLRAFGWRLEGTLPAEPKFVLIAAPHTSNWDLVLMLLCSLSYGMWPSWVGKHTIFQPPLGWLLRAPRRDPDRPAVARQPRRAARRALRRARPPDPGHPPRGVALEPHALEERLLLGRAHRERPGLPLLPRLGDPPGGLGPILHPTGDVRADMDFVRAFYAGRTGRFPELQGPIRLEGEDGPGDGGPAST